MTIFEFTILGHNFGIGISWDWTLLYHALIYGGTVPLMAYLHDRIEFKERHWTSVGFNFSECGNWCGLISSGLAAFYLEILQMWQYHWGCGMGDPVDLAVSWGSAYLVYRILRR